MSGASVSRPSNDDGQFAGEWNRDLSGSDRVDAGQTIAKNGGIFTARTARSRGASGNWDDDNQDFERNTFPYVPRNFASLIHGVRGTAGRGSRKYRFQRPTGTATRQVTLNLTTSSANSYRFDWDTDVIVKLPAAAAFPNDLSVLDARSVTIVGGKLTATGASPGLGGAVKFAGIKDFIWLEGVHFDLVGRVKSAGEGGGPDQHDAINAAGKSRAGSDQAHVIGDTAVAYRVGGVDLLDYTGTSIEAKYVDDPDWTRYSHPDIYLVSCRVEGVLGQESGGVHGDCLQYQGPVGSVFVDMFTGTTQYQGFQQQSAQGVTGAYHISRTNLKAYTPPGDQTADSAFLLWFASGGANRELPPVYLDEVYVGPSAHAGGTPFTIDELVNPNAAFHTTAGSREYLPVGFRDMGYLTSPALGLNVTAASNVFTSIRFNTDGINTTAVNHGFSNGDRVVFSRSSDTTKPGMLGGGVTWETVAYYVVNATSTTFQIALTSGGAAVTGITDFGSGTASYVNRKRFYAAPAFSMPYQGFVYEGLSTDTDWTTTAQCGVGYVSPGSQWDATTVTVPIVGWDGTTGSQPTRPAVPSGTAVLWVQPVDPFAAGVAVAGLDVWQSNA